MNNLSIFQYNQSPVRTVLIEGEPWFVATDVAAILNYSQAQAMCKLLDTDEVGSSYLDDGNKYLVISESGLYHASFVSKKEEAALFRKWVTSEVLPSIRKAGTYSIQNSDNASILLALNSLREDLNNTTKLLVEKDRLDKASKKHRGFREVIDYEADFQDAIDAEFLLAEDSLESIPLDAHTVKTYCAARNLPLNRGLLIRIGQLAASAYKYDKGKEPPKFNGVVFYRGTETKYIADAVKFVLGLG